MLSNIQRLITPSGRTKSGFLSDQAQLSGALLVAVTETWLSSEVFDSEVCHNFPGYSLFRCDREGRQGGGVGLYLREDMTGDILCSHDNGVCGLLVVMIHQLNTVVAVVYRPPDTRFHEFNDILVKLDLCLANLPAPTPTIALLGDFNLPRQCLTWSRCSDGSDGVEGPDGDGDLVPVVAGHRDSETLGGKQDRLQAAKLCDLATNHSLIQQVDQPTHGAEILDLIFTNNPDLISSVSVESWPSFTDHKLVKAFTSFELGSCPERHEVHLLESGRRLKNLNFNNAQWVEVQAELNEVDWSEMEEAAKESPTLALSKFMEELIPILERHIPAKKPSGKKIKCRMERRRKLLWRRISKIKSKTS